MARVYGRTYDEFGNSTWVVVTTDANGYNDAVMATAMVQTIKLNLNESPFWANSGLPQRQAVLQQVPPDYYVALIQQFYAPQFANLQITRTVGSDGVTPVYLCNVLTQFGSTLQAEVPV